MYTCVVPIFFFSCFGDEHFSSSAAAAACGGRGERDVDVGSADLLCLETEATGGLSTVNGFLRMDFSVFSLLRISYFLLLLNRCHAMAHGYHGL